MSEREEIKIGNISIDEKPRVSDVVGTARRFLDDFVSGIEAEGICKVMGVSTDKTFLLEGAPGTGKTMAVHALNNTLNRSFYEDCLNYKYMIENGSDFPVPNTDGIKIVMFEYAIGKYGSKFINENSRRVQDLFDVAGQFSEGGVKTAVVLDECDALLSDRASSIQSHSEDRKVLETIMKNLQISHDRENSYVILMTNLADGCDPASLRAGRIDKKYHFKLPNAKERIIGFKNTINSLNESAGYQVVRRVNYDEMAELSDGFSYADIDQSVRAAVKSRALSVAKERSKGIIPAAYITNKCLKRVVLSHKETFHPDRGGIGFI